MTPDELLAEMRAQFARLLERAERAELENARLQRMLDEACDEIHELKTRKVA